MTGELGLTGVDREVLEERGLEVDEVRRQVELLRDPPPGLRLARPATVGDGIERPTDADRTRLERRGADAASRVTRFVPASGAASRMFRDLVAARNGATEPAASQALRAFADSWRRLPFADALEAALRTLAEGPTDDHALLEAALGPPPGLGLADLPKGLIPFHRTAKGAATPFEEHLLEAAGHARDPVTGACRLHFTVPADFRRRIESFLEASRTALEEETDTRFEIETSVQSPSTDTVCLDSDGNLARDERGTLLLRPGGHGALLHNLEALGADLIVLKNIDNVVPAAHRLPVLRWKRILLGRLLELEETVDGLRSRVLEARDASALGDLATDMADEPSLRVPEDLPTAEADLRAVLRRALDRPLRVCGVVPNTGEPGGGPFWVEGADSAGLQIVETAQIDRDDPDQAACLARATHFNPVDVAARVRIPGADRGLSEFVDPRTAFVTRKSQDGRAVRALEHPGLWNGAMAGWITVFLEVPGETFAPVKTVFDLLRPEHLVSPTA